MLPKVQVLPQSPIYNYINTARHQDFLRAHSPKLVTEGRIVGSVESNIKFRFVYSRGISEWRLLGVTDQIASRGLTRRQFEFNLSGSSRYVGATKGDIVDAGRTRSSVRTLVIKGVSSTSSK